MQYSIIIIINKLDVSGKPSNICHSETVFMGPKKVRKIYFILFHLRGGVVGVKVKDSLTNFPKMSNSIIFLRVFGVLGGIL